MLHAIRIEASDSAPLDEVQEEVRGKVKSIKNERGGEALADQAKPASATPASVTQADSTTQLPARVVALHRFRGGRKDELVQKAIASVAHRAWWRVYYHECFHDERKPCRPWELVASSEVSQ